MSHYILIFLATLSISTILIYTFSKLFNKIWVLDNPKKYNLKRNPVPYAMWIIFFLSFFIISIFSIDYSYKLWLIWVFWFFITALSFLDDLMDVSAKLRLLFQILIWAFIGITTIKIWYISNIFWWIIDLETFYVMFFWYIIYIIPLLFTIIWYVFVFNALNWSDWIPGNTSWISIISFLIIFFLGLILFNKDEYIWGIQNAEFIMKISLILIGTLIPFWYLDSKNKILMWDSWTMFLGFMLATLAIISGWKIATVLVVFWIYSIDAVYVIIKRLLAKKNPLKWDFSHLHHRLLAIWLSKVQVLTLIYSLSFLFGLTALFLDKSWKVIVFIIIWVVVIFLNSIIEKLMKNKYNLFKSLWKK